MTWDGDAEQEFVYWFHGDHTDYTLRSERFYGDCSIEDLKTRESALHKWIHAAFEQGWEKKKPPNFCKTSMKPKFRLVLEMAIEQGVARGYRRAFKHIENPTEESIRQHIEEQVMSSLYEYFDFDEEDYQ
jgi:hypothetical protein